MNDCCCAAACILFGIESPKLELLVVEVGTLEFVIDDDVELKLFDLVVPLALVASENVLLMLADAEVDVETTSEDDVPVLRFPPDNELAAAAN